MNMPTKREDFNGLVTEGLKTTSRIIADVFGKEHYAVLRDIRNLVQKTPEWGAANFVAFKNNDLTGESTSHYEMTRDGYSMLVMGFTGKKAMEWKIKFLEAFSAMEAQIRQSGAFALPQTFGEALRLAADQHEQIEELKPKALALDRLDGASGSFTVRPASKALGIGEQKLIKWMEANRWAFRSGGKGPLQAYVDKRNAGYLDHKLHSYENSETGETKTAIQMLITAKGMARLAVLIGGAA